MKILCALLTLVSILIATEAAARRSLFKSAKASRETIENYEEFMPIITNEDDHKPYPLNLRVSVFTQLKNYSLVLHMNLDAVPSGFTSWYYDEEGKMVKDTNVYENCYYHGTVEGHPDWRVAMATCHGLQGEFGSMEDRDEKYHIEPLDHHSSQWEQVHVLYKDTEYKTPVGHCGGGDHSMKHLSQSMREVTVGRDYRVRRQSSAETVEWVVVNDNRQYVQHGSNLTATVRRAIAIASSMHDIYNSNFNIKIALVNSVTFSGSDRFTVVSDTSTLLNSFTTYVRANQVTLPSYDSIMLLTGIDLDGNTVGKAFVGTMCNVRSSLGLTQDGGRNLASVVTTAAHELGHIFNMNHDGDVAGCTCSVGTNRCVMTAISSGPSTIFSSCSRSSLQTYRNGGGLSCLSNSPSVVLETPRCGNGIVDAGETCDCGEPAHCTNPCCNANTCQLSTGSQCAVGQCCNTATCQFLPSTTVCRSRFGECDIQETCTGSSAFCPADVTMVDGTPCQSNAGYCVGGRCPTHADQCQAAWGTAVGFDACYNYNTNGGIGGNCGHSGSTYISCTSSNVRCGQLQCRAGTYQNIYSVSGGTLFTFRSGSGDCNSFGIRLPSDVMNPGLVQFGTRCGTNMVCSAQQCMTIAAALNPPTCPSGSNGMICSGSSRGICNNLGQCSCLSGYVPPNCEPATQVNECNTNNGGCAQVCTDTPSSFTCSCNSGYVLAGDGRACNDVNECTAGTHNCAQRCTNTVGSFTCGCNTGYTLNADGRNCNDINECSSNNGGCSQVCANTPGSFVCSCSNGYQLASNGRSCLDINECSSSSLNNCAQVCRNNAGGFTCDCNSGFRLNSDQRTCSDINECSSNNGGCEQVCTNTAGSFSCSCRSGYTPINGNQCVDVNECSTNNGGCSQICTNSVGSFTCSCREGYTSSGSNCLDVNECSSGNGGCQQTCRNTVGSFTCDCNSGFILANNGRTCDDINECASSNGGCAHTCSNTAGSFECSCRAGFQLTADGRGCVVINQCSQSNDVCDQFCMQTGTTVTCSCRTGFMLASDGRTCSDIDECATSNGNCSQLCTNRIGSFACLCLTGYVLDANGKTCNDINECADSNGGCSQVCTNTDSSFMCGCRAGYTLMADNINCADIDECRLEAGQVCQDTCINTAGSFMCGCSSGFSLASDGKTCTDINECATNNGGCTQSCKNTNGSFECSCNAGYVLSLNGFSCDDINECLRGDNGGCDQGCINSPPGSHNCTCSSAFVLQQDGRTCATLDSNRCLNGDRCTQFCHRDSDTDICSCRTGFVLDADGTTCNDINECSAGSDSCEHNCTNTVGGYICSCNPGTELAVDGISCRNITFTGGENQATQPPNTSQSGGPSAAAIAGGVIGALVAIILVALLIVGLLFFMKRRKENFPVKQSKPKPSYKPPPAQLASNQMTKSASAEDLLDGPAPSGDGYDSEDSFEDVEPAVYGNVNYDPEQGKHVPKRKQAPPPPPSAPVKKNAQSQAPPSSRRPAPTKPQGGMVKSEPEKIELKSPGPSANGKPSLTTKSSNPDPPPPYKLPVTKQLNSTADKPTAPWVKPTPPSVTNTTSEKPTAPWVKPTSPSVTNTSSEKPTAPWVKPATATPPPEKPITNSKPLPPQNKPNATPAAPMPVLPSTKPVPPSTKPVPPSTKPAPPSTKPVPPSTKPVPPSTKPTPPSAKPTPYSNKPTPPSAKPINSSSDKPTSPPWVKTGSEAGNSNSASAKPTWPPPSKQSSFEKETPSWVRDTSASSPATKKPTPPPGKPLPTPAARPAVKPTPPSSKPVPVPPSKPSQPAPKPIAPKPAPRTGHTGKPAEENADGRPKKPIVPLPNKPMAPPRR